VSANAAGASAQPETATRGVMLARVGWRGSPSWNRVSRSRVKIADMFRPELGIPRLT